MVRLGNFRKFLAANVHIKVARIFGIFLGGFEVCHFMKDATLISFWANTGKFGLILIPASGHTDKDPYIEYTFEYCRLR